MATQQEILKWRSALGATFPIVGWVRRRGAMRELVDRRGEADVIPILVEAAGSRDHEVAGGANAALGDLTAPMAIDALCALWAKGRDERLGAIIAEKGYVAETPLDVRILSALKCGKRVPVQEGKVAGFMAKLLGDSDEVVRAGAERDLRACAAGAGQDALCDEAIKAPQGAAAKICVEMGKRHGDHEKNCLYLFVTRQLEAYFKEDFEFQALRLEYDRADESVKGCVMDIVRSGDRRCAGFFVSGGGGKVGAKPLSECAEGEIKLAMDSWLRHSQWDKLFHACLELPLKYGWAALASLGKSGWTPQAAEMQSVFKQVLADSGGQAVPERRTPSAESSLFERWMEEGRSGKLASASEADLLKRLESGEPSGCVAAVSALSGKARAGSSSAQAVAKSPHWLVRLAGQVTGLTMDLTKDTVEDGNWWVKELATAAGVLEFWPARATPADLEALARAPKEAWAGRLGAARKVLRTVMGHRVTTGTFEPMVVEAAEFAGEFVMAGEAEFADDLPKSKKEQES